MIVVARRFQRLAFEQLKKIGVVMKKARYFITCHELPIMTVQELTPEYVRSLLVKKSLRKQEDERQLVFRFQE